jgi:hypothetical protein
MPPAAVPLPRGRTQPRLLGCDPAARAASAGVRPRRRHLSIAAAQGDADLDHDLLQPVALGLPDQVWRLEAVGR